MQVLILDDDPVFQAQLAQVMMGQGFNVLCVDTVPAAEAFLRLGMVDVLIAGERIGGKLSHAVALLAECRNPLLAAVLRTDRTGPDLDELFDLVPSVCGILGRGVAPALVLQVVLAATADARSGSATGRLAARWAAVEHLTGDPEEATPEDATGESGMGWMASHPSASPDPEEEAADADAAPSTAVPDRTRSPAGRDWDGLWPRIPAAADAPAAAPDDLAAQAAGPEAAPGAGEPLPLPVPLSAPPPLTAAQRISAALAAPGPVPTVPPVPARALRPSPDSPLARVMAAGSRAFGLPPATPGTAAAPQAPRNRGAALPLWLAGPATAARPPARAETATPPPPVPVPASLPVPAGASGRRLHLN